MFLCIFQTHQMKELAAVVSLAGLTRQKKTSADKSDKMSPINNNSSSDDNIPDKDSLPDLWIPLFSVLKVNIVRASDKRAKNNLIVC